MKVTLCLLSLLSLLLSFVSFETYAVNPPSNDLGPNYVSYGKCGDYHIVMKMVYEKDPRGGTNVTTTDLQLRDSKTLEKISLTEKLYEDKGGWGLGDGSSLKIPYFEGFDQKRKRLIHIQPIKSYYIITHTNDYAYYVYNDPGYKNGQMSNPDPQSKGICSDWSLDAPNREEMRKRLGNLTE